MEDANSDVFHMFLRVLRFGFLFPAVQFILSVA